MLFYQLKLIRKKDTGTWRNVFVPLDITFCQLALILEEMLQYPELSDLYEFEFFHKKYRIQELPEENAVVPNSNYKYLHAPFTYVNYWLDTQPWFTFRILDPATGKREQSLPEYRVECEKKISDITFSADGTPLIYPFIFASSQKEDDPYWFDEDEVNLMLRMYKLHEGKAEYPDFVQLLESVFEKNAGITVSPETTDLYTRNIESGEALRERKEDQLFQEYSEEMRRELFEYFEPNGDQKNLKISDEEFLKIMNEKETEVHTRVYKELEKILKDYPSTVQQEDILLGEILASCSKKYLLFLAQQLNLKVNEKKRTEELAAEIAEYLLDPENMRVLLLFVSEGELNEFDEVLDRGLFWPMPGEEELLQELYNMTYITKYDTGEFAVPDDVKAVYKLLLQEDYRKYHKAARWLLLCMNAFDLILGFAPIRILYSMFREGNTGDCTYEEFLDLFENFPEDINHCYVSDGTVVSALLLETGMYDFLKNEQQDVMYYIPTKMEIESYGEDYYPTLEPAYQELFRWLRDEFEFEPDDCKNFCSTACRIFSIGGSAADFLQEMYDRDIEFRSDKELNQTIEIAKRAIANTRQVMLRGHTADEMSKMKFSQGMTSAPSGSTAGDILKMPKNTLEAKGIGGDSGIIPGQIIPVDFTAGTNQNPAGREKKKKIGPNDPCPCGSGKKYKKCCGRNRGF